MDRELDEKKQDTIIKKNALYSVIFKGVSYFVSFFNAPLLLSCLGDYKYGVYATTLSIISWIYYFDFGVGSGLRNKLTESLTKGDYGKARNYVNVSYILISAVSIAAFVVIAAFVCIFDVEGMLNIHMTDEKLNRIILAAALLACVNFVMSLSTVTLHSLQKTGLANGFDVLSKVIMLAALLIYKWFNIKALMIAAVIEGAAQLIRNLIVCGYIYITAKEISPNFKDVDFQSSKEILDFGIKIFFMQISALILNATDNLIITRYFGAEAVTPYSMCHKYFAIISAFYVATISPLGPTYVKFFTLKNVKYIKKTMKKSFIPYACAFLIILASLFIFKPFMRIYLGKDLAYQPGLIPLAAMYYAVLLVSHNFSGFVHATGHLGITTITCIITAVINVPASIFFAVYLGWGVNGVIAGSNLCLIISAIAYIYTAIIEIKKMGEEKA